MTEPYIGQYTVVDRPDPGCGYPQSVAAGPQERAPRRRDVMPPTWGKGGVPRQDTCRGQDVLGVLAVPEMRPLETLMTEQGTLMFPFGPSPDATYTPSVAALNALPFTDTRATGISDRYYK